MSATHTLSWTEELVLGDARTDHTHQEFIDLVNATTAAPAEAKLAVYQQLLAHTVEHFAQEERWMLACGIQPDFCHFGQHASVLQVMQEVDRRALNGEPEYIASMIEALVEWFPSHANSMDASLVSYLQEKGFDTATETFREGATVAPEAAVPSCGHAPGEPCA
ncbi:MAG: hemerythrin domain-containing protein [Hylemonella sp.]|nr:hemerythrin domain-containing protein [Hylemonella sp.]